jgi:hypothetical protein
MRFYIATLAILVSFFYSGTVPAQTLGRLFSSPAERAELDLLRKQSKPGAKLEETSPARILVQPPEELFTFDGFVKRSSGKETTWVNQVAHTEQKSTQTLKVRQQISKPPAITVLLPTGRRLDLKVGQTFDHRTGKVHDLVDAEQEKKASSVATKSTILKPHP